MACDSKKGEQKRIETFGAKLEDSPSAPAIPDSANFLKTMLLLQSFRGRFDFWEALFFGMALEEESVEVEFLGFLGVGHRAWRYNLALKADRGQRNQHRWMDYRI